MESLYLFPLYVFLLLCACVLLRQLYRVVRGQNTSWRSTLLTGFALIPLLAMVCHLVWPSGTDYNPGGVTQEAIVGTYVSGESELQLFKDGSYSSRNLEGLGEGTWSHDDWNLRFSHSNVEQARWILRRGTPVILPYYDSLMESDGLALKKQ